MARPLPDWLKAQPIAHRGLHDEGAGVVENTLAAFDAAAAAGYAIELDVRLSGDGEAIVFHDGTLDRLTFSTGALTALSAADLAQVPLKNTKERIPTFRQMLETVAGRVPLLVELKSYGARPAQLEARVADLLKAYSGAYAVQSFNPQSVAWYVRNEPGIPRGQLSMRYARTDMPGMSVFRRIALSHLLLNRISKPDFIGYEWSALPATGPSLARRAGLPVIAWTIKSADSWERTRPYADNLIFEGFRP